MICLLNIHERIRRKSNQPTITIKRDTPQRKTQLETSDEGHVTGILYLYKMIIKTRDNNCVDKIIRKIGDWDYL